MIDLRHITLTFPDGDSVVTAIDDVTLNVSPGSVVGITGPSGSGKSSLLAVASTLIKPAYGTVRIDGVDATRLSLAESSTVRRDKLGIVFQQSNLLPALTVEEQLLVMSRLTGRRLTAAARHSARTHAHDLIEAVHLTGHANRRPAQLSGGERQRVNIARALMNDPKVLIIDEPTAALDQALGSSILDLIIALTTEHNTATLLVTHDERLLSRMAKSYTMIDGRLHRELKHDVKASPSDLFDQARV